MKTNKIIMLDPDEDVTIEVIEGVEGGCVVINDVRVAGPKPWGGVKTVASWRTKGWKIARALTK